MKNKNKSVLEDTKQTALQQLIERLKMDIDYYTYILNKKDYSAYHNGVKAKKMQAESTLNDAESLLSLEKKQIVNAFCNAYLIGEDDISKKDAKKSAEEYINQTYTI